MHRGRNIPLAPEIYPLDLSPSPRKRLWLDGFGNLLFVLYHTGNAFATGGGKTENDWYQYQKTELFARLLWWCLPRQKSGSILRLFIFLTVGRASCFTLCRGQIQFVRLRFDLDMFFALKFGQEKQRFLMLIVFLLERINRSTQSELFVSLFIVVIPHLNGTASILENLLIYSLQ